MESSIRKRLRRDGVVPVEHKVIQGDHRRESAIERDILKWLNSEGGFFGFKNNSVGVFDRNNGNFRKSSSYAINGVSDIIALRDGRVFFVEVKTPTGKQSPDQVKFQKAVTTMGCIYVVVHSVEEMQDYSEEWFGV